MFRSTTRSLARRKISSKTPAPKKCWDLGLLLFSLLYKPRLSNTGRNCSGAMPSPFNCRGNLGTTMVPPPQKQINSLVVEVGACSRKAAWRFRVQPVQPGE